MEIRNWPDWTCNAGGARKRMEGLATAEDRTTSLELVFFFSFLFFHRK